MIKDYIKLVYRSLLSALLLVLIVKMLQHVFISNIIFNQTILGLVLIQLAVYTYKDYKWIQSFLKTKFRVVFNYYIPVLDTPFIQHIYTIEVLKTSLYQLNVIRC